MGWVISGVDAGMGAFTGFSNAQCLPQGAPSAIQRRSSSACSAVSGGLCDFGGGITSSASLETMRSSRLLSAGRPGTITSSAPSRVSRRRSALRCASSGPWQLRQFSESKGRISWLKLTLSSAKAGSVSSSKMM